MADDCSMSENDIQVHIDTSDDDSKSQVILSIIWYRSILGAAYYDIDTCQMFVMKDQPDYAPTFRYLNLLIKEVEPQYIVTSCKTSEQILNILRDSGIGRQNSSDASSDISRNEDAFIHLLPSIDFAYEYCKQRLENIKLPNMPQNIERRIYMSTLIDFSNLCMVKAAGGLMKFLEKKRVGVQLESYDVFSPISSLSIFTLSSVVAIDNCTFNALQIFQQDGRPSVYKNSLGSRGGLSLFGICNRCKSAVGSKELRKWFLLPTNDINVIHKRQEAIKFFVSIQNMEVTHSLCDSLRSIKSLSGILSRMRTAEASIGDWQRLYKAVYHAVTIGDICRTLPKTVYIFKEISEVFTPELLEIAVLINKIINFEESVNQNRFVVKLGVNELLDSKKRTYNGLPDFMTKIAHQELQHLSEDIQECSVIYLPQLGYLLAVPETNYMKVSKDYVVPSLDFMFISNGIVHYKSFSMIKLDHLLGDTQCEITDHETQIMHSLQNTVLEMSEILLKAVKYSAELDCLISFATIAKEFNYVSPVMKTDGCLSIIKGRHPLQELYVAAFVPNDTTSGGEYAKIHILTSPNTSGKSVYLKQVALIIFMAHLGSFVPAESAEVPLIDQIFTRVQTVESISISLSTFLMELYQMSYALKYATQKSIVIIDEFGNGTEAKGGFALYAASILYWLQKETACPHLFVSTHFHSIFHLLPDSNMLIYQTLEVLKNEEELVFLYHLIDGKADRSYSHSAALVAGLPEHIVERGFKVYQLFTERQPISPRNSEASEKKYKKFKTITETFLKLDVDNCYVTELLKYVLDTKDSLNSDKEATATKSSNSNKR